MNYEYGPAEMIVENMSLREKIEHLSVLLREAQPYVCLLLDKAENYGKARILNEKINDALRSK